MSSRFSPLVLRLALLVALGVSAALLIDYLRPLPTFCDVGSSCAKVRASYGTIAKVLPVPLVGFVGFTLLMGISLMEGATARRLTRVLSLAAGVTGALLLLVQGLVLHMFCKLCVAVDLAAIVAAVAAVTSPPLEEIAPPPAARWLWPVATVAAILLPGVWALAQPPPPVPPEIASLWVPDKINVVEFADFQCPFCRQLHPTMEELLGEYADRVHFVRLNMPLPNHSMAHGAARAYCCAETLGKGEPMANALFQSDNLTPEACEQIAIAIGLPLPEYRTCVTSASTEQQLNDEMTRVRSTGLRGLPTVWIGDQMFVGLQPIEKLRAAFSDAAGGKASSRLPSALLWVLFAGALAITGAIAVRAGERERAR